MRGRLLVKGLLGTGIIRMKGVISAGLIRKGTIRYITESSLYKPML